MVGRMSAGRCCCPGGGGDPSCIVYDEIDDNPSYTICAGGWTIDQTAGTYYTNDADSKLIFTSAATGNAWRFRISVQIEKMSTPYVGDGVAKVFAAASQCSNGETISITKDYDGSSFVSAELALSGDTLDLIDASIYDLEICSDGTAVTVHIYDPFENVITTRTFSFTGGVFGIGTGALGADVRVTFYNPRLENINGFQCPNCTPSCCYGPSPDEMTINLSGFTDLFFSCPEQVCGLDCEFTWRYNLFLSQLNGEHTLTLDINSTDGCQWIADIPVDWEYTIHDHLNGGVIDYTGPGALRFILTYGYGQGYGLYTVLFGDVIWGVESTNALNECYPDLVECIGNYLGFGSINWPGTGSSLQSCDNLCDYSDAPLGSAEMNVCTAGLVGNPTAQFKTPCLGFAMPATGYGIPKDSKPIPEPELPEDVKQWLMQQAPSSKTPLSSSESEPTKDADAQS